MGDAAAIEVTTCNVRQKSDSNYCCSVSAEPLELGAEGPNILARIYAKPSSLKGLGLVNMNQR